MSGETAPLACSSSSALAIARWKSRGSPAHLAEWMPGAPPKASIARPEVVGQRGHSRGEGGDHGFELRVLFEGIAALDRLWNAQLAG